MIHGDEINLNLNQVYIHSDSGSRKVLYTPHTGTLHSACTDNAPDCSDKWMTNYKYHRTMDALFQLCSHDCSEYAVTE